MLGARLLAGVRATLRDPASPPRRVIRAVRFATHWTLWRTDPLAWAAGWLGRRRRLPVTAVCVYRARNARLVRRLVREARTGGWDLRMWALDDVLPEFAAYTRGHGPGGRFANLNRLLQGSDPLTTVLVIDDDTRFKRGDLRAFVGLSSQLGFDLAQPARIGRRSWHPITRRRPWVMARETTFVEIGPVVGISPRLRTDILPFPEQPPMGWGTDILWCDLLAAGYRFGVVDSLPVWHVGPVGLTYAHPEEAAHITGLLQARGLSSMRDLQRVKASYCRLTRRSE